MERNSHVTRGLEMWWLFIRRMIVDLTPVLER